MPPLSARAGWLLAALAFASGSALAADAPAKQKPASKPAAQSAAKPTPGARPETKKKQAQAKPAQRAQPKQPAAPASPAATADCSVETVAETGPVTYTVPIPRPGTSRRVAECLVSAKRAAVLVAKGNLLVVDVRNAPQFEQYRIPGSLNIPLSFVKTKQFLKRRPFVLVNEGRTSGTLEAACKELRAAGFKQAGVLRGGLAAWRGAKGAVEGDLLAQRELRHMRPGELAAEGGYGDWIVLSLANVPSEELRRFVPQAVPLAVRDDAQLAAAVKSAVAKRTRKGGESKVLVLDDDGSRMERIEYLLQGQLAQPAFVLEGGLAGYRQFWTEQAAIWAAADRGPRKPRCGA